MSWTDVEELIDYLVKHDIRADVIRVSNGKKLLGNVGQEELGEVNSHLRAIILIADEFHIDLSKYGELPYIDLDNKVVVINE